MTSETVYLNEVNTIINNEPITEINHNIRNVFKRLVARKSISQIRCEAGDKNPLKRKLGCFQTLALGVGSIIGTGVFMLSGEVAAKYAGPSVILSFIVAALIAGLAALSYAELASMMPTAGSTYSYVYASMGELIAWVIGWNLLLEYILTAATIAVGWSNYFTHFLRSFFQCHLPEAISFAPFTWNKETEHFQTTGHIFNIPAALIVILLMITLIAEVDKSAILNLIFVIIKLSIILLFVFSCCMHVRKENYQPFFPRNEGSFSKYGVTGMFHGGAIVFFAYIGFDTITSVAQEVENPTKALPIGIIGSLTASSLLYVAVCTVMVGIVPFRILNSSNPLSTAISGTPYGVWLPILIDLGVVAGLTSVTLVHMLGQSRLCYALARDGLLPSFFEKIHSKTKVPWFSTIFNGSLCALLAGLFPLDILNETTTIGTLLAFFLIHISLIILRIKYSDEKRAFRIPFGPWLIPLTGAVSSLCLIGLSSKQTYLRLILWTIIGLFIYLIYGFSHSKLRKNQSNQIESVDDCNHDEDEYL